MMTKRRIATSDGSTSRPAKTARIGRSRAVRFRVAGVLCATGAVFVLAGCQQPLFPETGPRTQFETYRIMRQEYVPTEQPDVFGNPRPALRARLQQ